MVSRKQAECLLPSYLQWSFVLLLFPGVHGMAFAMHLWGFWSTTSEKIWIYFENVGIISIQNKSSACCWWALPQLRGCLDLCRVSYGELIHWPGTHLFLKFLNSSDAHKCDCIQIILIGLEVEPRPVVPASVTCFILHWIPFVLILKKIILGHLSLRHIMWIRVCILDAGFKC